MIVLICLNRSVVLNGQVNYISFFTCDLLESCFSFFKIKLFNEKWNRVIFEVTTSVHFYFESMADIIFINWLPYPELW